MKKYKYYEVEDEFRKNLHQTFGNINILGNDYQIPVVLERVDPREYHKILEEYINDNYDRFHPMGQEAYYMKKV